MLKDLEEVMRGLSDLDEGKKAYFELMEESAKKPRTPNCYIYAREFWDKYKQEIIQVTDSLEFMSDYDVFVFDSFESSSKVFERRHGIGSNPV